MIIGEFPSYDWSLTFVSPPNVIVNCMVAAFIALYGNNSNASWQQLKNLKPIAHTCSGHSPLDFNCLWCIMEFHLYNQLFSLQDNSLQAVWANATSEQRLIRFHIIFTPLLSHVFLSPSWSNGMSGCLQYNSKYW